MRTEDMVKLFMEAFGRVTLSTCQIRFRVVADAAGSPELGVVVIVRGPRNLCAGPVCFMDTPPFPDHHGHHH